MNRCARRLSDEASYLKYLKPGALAKLRDSKISARSHSKLQISVHRTLSPAASYPVRPPSAVQIASDDIPCFGGRIYGIRCTHRKKLVAAQQFFLPLVMEFPDPIISNDVLVGH